MPPPTVPPPKIPSVTVGSGDVPDPAVSDMARGEEEDDRDRWPSVEGEEEKVKHSVSPIEKRAAAMIDS